MKYCPNCGSPVRETDRFCQKCGFNLVAPPHRPEDNWVTPAAANDAPAADGTAAASAEETLPEDPFGVISAAEAAAAANEAAAAANEAAAEMLNGSAPNESTAPAADTAADITAQAEAAAAAEAAAETLPEDPFGVISAAEAAAAANEAAAEMLNGDTLNEGAAPAAPDTAAAAFDEFTARDRDSEGKGGKNEGKKSSGAQPAGNSFPQWQSGDWQNNAQGSAQSGTRQGGAQVPPQQNYNGFSQAAPQGNNAGYGSANGNANAQPAAPKNTGNTVLKVVGVILMIRFGLLFVANIGGCVGGVFGALFGYYGIVENLLGAASRIVGAAQAVLYAVPFLVGLLLFRNFDSRKSAAYPVAIAEAGIAAMVLNLFRTLVDQITFLSYGVYSYPWLLRTYGIAAVLVFGVLYALHCNPLEGISGARVQDILTLPLLLVDDAMGTVNRTAAEAKQRTAAAETARSENAARQAAQTQANGAAYGTAYAAGGRMCVPGVKNRNLVLAIVLTIVTCGIYGVYWFVCLVDDLNRATNDNNAQSGIVVVLLTIITCGIYGLYWWYKAGEKVDRLRTMEGLPPQSSGLLYLLLSLFGLGIVDFAILQSELNNVATM